MIAVQDGVALPKPKRKPKSEPPKVAKAYAQYAEAYKRAYGMQPPPYTYDVDTKFVRIGSNAGVSVVRLRELTRLLRNR
jgi:hypothetical protein